MPSQSPSPAAQVVRTHVPRSQRAPAPEKLQTVRHAPQLRVLLAVSVSQPLPASPSQLPKPAAHAMAHAPAAQVGVPLVRLHARPQPLQWSTLVVRFTSHPLAGLPSQSA